MTISTTNSATGSNLPKNWRRFATRYNRSTALNKKPSGIPWMRRRPKWSEVTVPLAP